MVVELDRYVLATAWPMRLAPAEAEAAARELGGRIVLKILSAEITHKSDVGGVAVNVTPETVGARLQ
ncbi:MAG: acetate--CoA ligase family protein, partial [Sphingomonas sp.]|nr:acetate--CoA ligase family protein [Sphingomonas sp.]